LAIGLRPVKPFVSLAYTDTAWAEYQANIPMGLTQS